MNNNKNNKSMMLQYFHQCGPEAKERRPKHPPSTGMSRWMYPNALAPGTLITYIKRDMHTRVQTCIHKIGYTPTGTADNV